MNPPLDAISLENIHAGYHNNTALDSVTTSFKMNSLTAIIGPNGSGKSTLLKVIMGHLPPFQGQIRFPAFSALKEPRTACAYLPQRCDLDHNFPVSVRDVVTMGLWRKIGPFQGITDQLKQQINKALLQVNIEGLENRLVSELSGGQFQRALFARLILEDADIILLDEPFSGIDEKTTHELMQLILGWHKQGKTILAVNHDIELVRQYFPETLFLMKTVVSSGHTKEVLDNLGVALKNKQESALEVLS